MGAEIERKWVVDDFPYILDRFPSEEISQGYLQTSEEKDEIRVRKKGSEYFLTVKSGSGLKRDEAEPEIPEITFRRIWPATAKSNGGLGRIEKNRYYVLVNGGYTADLDEYRGDLEGRMTVEVEFGSEEESRRFIVPDWFGEEVTEDRKYKNFSLAQNGWPETA